MVKTSRRSAKILAAATAVPACVLIAGTAVAVASPAHPGTRAAAATHSPPFQVAQLLNGAKLHHTFMTGGKTKSEPLAGPDDLAFLGGTIYTGFQNGVGSQGEPSTSGNTDGTIVGFSPSGKVVHQWDIKGKIDGVGANPVTGQVIATVNEDANSSIYTINPGASVTGGKIVHYKYNKPLPHKGGTDAITVIQGVVVISASAPGTSGKAPANAPALYLVTFNRKTHIATVNGLLPDNSTAIVANTGASHGKKIKLALTDPDSNSFVPSYAPRFAGAFELTSQADKEQIFAPLAAAKPQLFVLKLSQSVDDTVWTAPPPGRIFATDSGTDSVDVVTGHFGRGVYVAVTPCDAGNAPSTCPAPGFPPNYLGSLNPFTGHVTKVPVTGVTFNPKGMLFLPNP